MEGPEGPLLLQGRTARGRIINVVLYPIDGEPGLAPGYRPSDHEASTPGGTLKCMNDDMGEDEFAARMAAASPVEVVTTGFAEIRRPAPGLYTLTAVSGAGVSAHRSKGQVVQQSQSTPGTPGEAALQPA